MCVCVRKLGVEVIIMHKVTMMVSVPDEHWEAFVESLKESGEVQFKYRNATIFAEMFWYCES